MKSLFLILICVSSLLFSYGKNPLEEASQKLSQNGVTIVTTNKEYTQQQYFLLQTFDFTNYRNFTTERLVQIEDGPMVQLSSLSEMIQNGNQIPEEILKNKKDEVSNTNLHKIITLINIGFRYGAKLNKETGY